MNSILLYVDPQEDDRRQMIQMAADIVEALTFRSKRLDEPPHFIGIIAEPSACLEIGLSMLGRGETRTVEGGERRASPVRLFPFVTGLDREDGEIDLIGRGESESGNYGTLDDLVMFGAVEQDPDFPLAGRKRQRALEVLERVSRARPWQHVAVFAPRREFEEVRTRLDPGADIVNVAHFETDGERADALLGQLEPVESEGPHAAQKDAVVSALRFESLLSRRESSGRMRGLER